MNTKLNLNDINFNIAFTVEGYIDKELKNDHRYVKFMARILTKREGVESYTVIPFDYCTKK